MPFIVFAMMKVIKYLSHLTQKNIKMNSSTLNVFLVRNSKFLTEFFVQIDIDM